MGRRWIYDFPKGTRAQPYWNSYTVIFHSDPLTITPPAVSLLYANKLSTIRIYNYTKKFSHFHSRFILFSISYPLFILFCVRFCFTNQRFHNKIGIIQTYTFPSVCLGRWMGRSCRNLKLSHISTSPFFLLLTIESRGVGNKPIRFSSVAVTVHL